MPTYNGAKFIGETLKSILNQNFKSYELIIVDDRSSDTTLEIIKSFKDKRIKYSQNKKNLGYPQNLKRCLSKCRGEIIYLMAQDDILAHDALLKTYQAFTQSEAIGAVTRPYFWFDETFKQPVRAKKQLNPNKNELVRINDNLKRVVAVFKTLDQLSGLALRKKYLQVSCGKDIFTCHVLPFATIFKTHPVVFLKDYTVAVRIRSSQTRHLKSIYYKSPLQSWVDLFNFVFPEKKFKNLRNYCLKNFIANNYVGLIQIRNYAGYKYLLREIYLLLKYRPANIFNLLFWFFVLLSLSLPSFLLIPLTDFYKNHLNSKLLKRISFNYK